MHPGSRGRTCAKGPGDHQPGPRLRAHPASAQAHRPARLGRVRGGQLGARPSRTSAAASARPSRRTGTTRSCTTSGVPARTTSCCACCRPGASTVTTATPTCAAPRRALRLHAVVRRRPPVARLLGHEVHAAALGAPRDRALLQPARAADHGRQGGGARLAVVDTRLSEHGVPRRPLGVALAGLRGGACSWAWRASSCARLASTAPSFKRWTNWRGVPRGARPRRFEHDFERFLEKLKELYDAYTPDYVASECQVPADTVHAPGDEIARAGSRFSSHLWRNTASGNLGGWQVARALMFLHVLTGSVGTPGGVNPNAWDKFVPKPSHEPAAHVGEWNERIWPREWPLAHYEMSFLLATSPARPGHEDRHVLHARLQPGLDQPGRLRRGSRCWRTRSASVATWR